LSFQGTNFLRFDCWEGGTTDQQSNAKYGDAFLRGASSRSRAKRNKWCVTRGVPFMVRQEKSGRSSQVKGISHVKEYQRHVADRAGYRVSDGTGAWKAKVRAVAKANSGMASKGKSRVVRLPYRMKPEPLGKNDTETSRWTLRGGRRQRVPKERPGTWEALQSRKQGKWAPA
jgi:hypothetical protein